MDLAGLVRRNRWLGVGRTLLARDWPGSTTVTLSAVLAGIISHMSRYLELAPRRKRLRLG